MASKSHVTAAVLIFHLLFSSLVSGQTPGSVPVPPPPPPRIGLLPCVINVVSLAICAPVVLVLKLIGIGNPNGPCCTLIKGLSANQAASCLCLAVRANILGINITIPGDTGLLLKLCNVTLPIGLGCPT
ncbi:unnamed protein product [Spirodela intermedia]|uniref:Bifunctional inhibitor/plant lipid transfer protein/seed storage helical domain-containing protein n=2 Tax=Spirodela intermedia TaxID=51605 RepID=A0A7I8IVP9_SPIIN|nr:unnamed protein product [Spirodela intermedia]CAA6662068.1 unnamed protein product [Spirodela intermedia]CAA6674213.1 unnamed protein product [Spirodela intermedia]CAA7392183.1 unnamed protein product [Spirodela intermedia]